VLSGPSGVGKSTVVAHMRKVHPEVWLSVSATTRKPRPGEKPGVQYYFVDDDEFDTELESMAAALAAGPTTAYGWIKRTLTATTLSDLHDAQSLELQGQEALVQTDDFRAAVRAFRRQSNG